MDTFQFGHQCLSVSRPVFHLQQLPIFLKQGIGAGLCAATWAHPAAAKSPNGKIHHAAIGVGGKGWSDLMAFASHPEVAIEALCDVDSARVSRAAEKFPQARCYQDWL